MQGTAGVICRELGFRSGIAQLLREVPDTDTILPPWLIASRRVCSGGEAAFSECGPFSFGDTLLCGPPQRLVCVDPGSTGTYNLLHESYKEALNMITYHKIPRHFDTMICVCCPDHSACLKRHVSHFINSDTENRVNSSCVQREPLWPMVKRRHQHKQQVQYTCGQSVRRTRHPF